MLETVRTLKEELIQQAGLLDKEMILHKAALEQLISASSLTVTPLKRVTLPTSTPSPPQLPQQSTHPILHPESPSVISMSLPLTTPSPGGNPSTPALSDSTTHGQSDSTTHGNDLGATKDDSVSPTDPLTVPGPYAPTTTATATAKATATTQVTHAVTQTEAILIQTPGQGQSCTTTEEDGGREREKEKEKEVETAVAEIQTDVEPPDAHEKKIIVLSDEIRSLNRWVLVLTSDLGSVHCTV